MEDVQTTLWVAALIDALSLDSQRDDTFFSHDLQQSLALFTFLTPKTFVVLSGGRGAGAAEERKVMFHKLSKTEQKSFLV